MRTHHRTDDSTTDHDPLVVMESLSRPRPTTNPYLIQLCRSLQAVPGVELHYFCWRRALIGKLDVFHVHWPELLIHGHRRIGRVARRILTAAFIVRIRLTRVAVVRTMHNLEKPSGLGKVDRVLLRQLDRCTTTIIALNDSTPVPSGLPRDTVLHGHYRDWFAAYPTLEPTPNRLGYVGLIRRYKGVEQLVQAFLAWDPHDAELAIAGKPSTSALSTELITLANDDVRIGFRFEFLDDADLVEQITTASLIVLPYRHMHNSGTVLAALSLSRPVLVPDNEVNRALAEEVGPGWVFLFEGELTAEHLRATVEGLRTAAPATPDLSRRDWDEVGAQHAQVFRRAAELKTGRK